MMNRVQRFAADESAAVAIEYALIMAAIGIASFSAIQLIGTFTAGLFSAAVASLDQANP
jgi:Flp pilus assembly pilin Flp